MADPILGIDTPFIKDPDEVLDYQINWAVRLDVNDIVTVSDWLEPTPDTLTIDDERLSEDGKVTTVWFSGGVVGTTYKITNRVVTVAGRTMDQTIKVKIKER